MNNRIANNRLVNNPIIAPQVKEGRFMLKTRILLLSSIVPAVAWAASTDMGPSRLIIQVVCAVAVSFTIFIAILRATERKTSIRHRVSRRSRATAALALTPPLSLQTRKSPASGRIYARSAPQGGISA